MIFLVNLAGLFQKVMEKWRKKWRKNASKSFSLIINPKSPPIPLSCKQSITMGQEKRATLAGEMVPENTELSNTGWTPSAARQLKN